MNTYTKENKEVVERFRKIWSSYPKNSGENSDGLDKIISDFIVMSLFSARQQVKDELKEQLSKKKMGYYLPRILKGIDPKDAIPEFIGAGGYNDVLDDVISLLDSSEKDL